MAQSNIGTGFQYATDLTTVLDPWRPKLGNHFDSVVALLTDRERSFEQYLESAIPAFDYVFTEESTTSTVDTDLATNGPEVTLKLPRGRALISGGAFTTSTVNNQTAFVALWIDGAFYQDIALLSNATGGSIGASVFGTFAIPDPTHPSLPNGLSPGVHTFKLRYLGSDGNTVRFGSRSLLVQPIP